MLGSVRDCYAVTSVKHLGAVSEFDLKLTFENETGMTAFTPVWFHVCRVFDESESPVLEWEDFVTNSLHRRGPLSRLEVKSVFHIMAFRKMLDGDVSDFGTSLSW